MTETKPCPPEGGASEQADYWLALLNSPFAGDDSYRSFRSWLEESADNRAAFEKSLRFWQATEQLGDSRIDALERRFGPLTKASVSKQDPRRQKGLRRLGFRELSAAACLLAAIVFGMERVPWYLADYRTGTGEQRSLRLEDGSRVLMNTGTALSVDYGNERRVVTLIEGEAYFQVAADANRPFDVRTERGRVRALGTAFDVRQRDGAVSVTVYEHAVRVTFDQQETLNRLETGQRIVLTRDHPNPVEAVDVRRSGAWHEHRLVFKEQALRRVIDELNRYRFGKIVLFGERLGQRPVTGVFDIRDTDAALTAIEETLPVSVYRSFGGFTLLVGS